MSYHERNSDLYLIAVSKSFDAYWAQRLAVAIRNYDPPKGLETEESARKYRRVFVDMDARLCDDNTKSLLARSRFLGVICSPDTKDDPVVAEKLAYYASIGKKDHIIPILIKDEPMDSFSEFFITSDLRANSKRTATKLLRYETVRIVAALLGVRPDVLEQREQKRIKRRRTTIVAVAGAVCITMAATFGYFGAVAKAEGDIAAAQTAEGAKMVSRMMGELPLQFADLPETLPVIDETALEGAESMILHGSQNLIQMNLTRVLTIQETDEPEIILRKAALLRQLTRPDEAKAAYRIAMERSPGLTQEEQAAFLKSADWFAEYLNGDGAGMYVFGMGLSEGSPLQRGMIILAVNGEKLERPAQYYEVLEKAPQDAVFELEYASLEHDGVARTSCSREDLLPRYVIGI